MKITKVNLKTDMSKILHDKTDWKKIYQQSQTMTDIEAQQDEENPVLKNARVRKLNETKKP